MKRLQALFQLIISGGAVAGIALAVLWAGLEKRVDAKVSHGISAYDIVRKADRDTLLAKQGRINTRLLANVDSVKKDVDSLLGKAKFQEKLWEYAFPHEFQQALREKRRWE